MLGGLARADQRAKGELYLRGLLVDGKRKSMQPMADRLGVDHQQLQQFVTSSTWDHVEVRKRVARWADDFLHPEAAVPAGVAAAFEVVESESVFQFAVVVLDPPADLGESDDQPRVFRTA